MKPKFKQGDKVKLKDDLIKDRVWTVLEDSFASSGAGEEHVYCTTAKPDGSLQQNRFVADGLEKVS